MTEWIEKVEPNTIQLRDRSVIIEAKGDSVSPSDHPDMIREAAHNTIVTIGFTGYTHDEYQEISINGSQLRSLGRLASKVLYALNIEDKWLNE